MLSVKERPRRLRGRAERRSGCVRPREAAETTRCSPRGPGGRGPPRGRRCERGVFMPRVGVQGKEEAPGGASPFRGRGGVSRWFFPFTCLKIKNSSPDVSCASGPICLDDRVSSRSVEINKHRETTSNNRRHAAGRAGGGEPPTSHGKAFRFPVGTALRARGQATRLPRQARPLFLPPPPPP